MVNLCISKRKKTKATKKQGQTIKEIKMSHKISSNDYNTRLNQTIKFLGKIYKIKLTITFRGREIIFRDTLGMELVNNFLEDIENYGTKDNDVVKSVRNIRVLINPK